MDAYCTNCLLKNNNKFISHILKKKLTHRCFKREKNVNATNASVYSQIETKCEQN